MAAQPRYPTPSLQQAVAATTCMTELLEALGVELTRGRRAAMWARLGQLGIDTSHWVRSSHARRLYPDDALREAVAGSTSMAGVMRALAVRLTGGSHAHLRRRILEAGIDTSHFLGQAHNRGKPGPRRSAEDILTQLPDDARRPHGKLLARAMLESGVAHCCAVCGLGTSWCERPLRLSVDHIDGDWLDNRLANLRFLCPNCHSQTATWCRKKGS